MTTADIAATTDTAMLVVDVQVGMFDASDPVYNGEALLDRISYVLDNARRAGLPIIYIQHQSDREGHPLKYGTAGWHIHPAIAPHPGDPVIAKTMPDSFYETRLRDELTARGIKRLIIAGIQTDLCVDTTTRRAVSEGYDVTLVSDAHSTWNSGELTAAQIIAHHNNILSDWFATVKPASEIVSDW
ncbi:MAG: cysteine hydrolase family protein [Ktedonobacterales bacterium]